MLFVGVTVACVWLGWNMNWIRQRREVLKKIEEYSFASPSDAAPSLLWLFGEHGYERLPIRTSGKAITLQEQAELDRILRLFPEATILRMWEDEDGTQFDPSPFLKLNDTTHHPDAPVIRRQGQSR